MQLGVWEVLTVRVQTSSKFETLTRRGFCSGVELSGSRFHMRYGRGSAADSPHPAGSRAVGPPPAGPGGTAVGRPGSYTRVRGVKRSSATR